MFHIITENMRDYHGIDPYYILETNISIYNSLSMYELNYLYYIYSILETWKYYEYEEIPRCVIEVLDEHALQALKKRPIGTEVEEVMNHYTMQELKILVQKNYGEVWGNKNYKKNWARAFLYTKKYGFNVFAIHMTKHDILYEDVLNGIKNFL
jgi:hypothetical protein